MDMTRPAAHATTWPRFALWIGMLAATATVTAKGPAFVDPEKVDADFAVQGEYLGTLSVDGDDVKVGVQVVALGGGKFRLSRYLGGLPGAGWNGEAMSPIDSRNTGDGAIEFAAAESRGVYRDGRIDVFINGDQVGVLAKTHRKSPTLGAEPPAEAIVLFDGTSAEAWRDGKLEHGLLVQGATSKQKFQGQQLHIEFRLPYQPEDRGQGRGNSGLYLQGRYEVQMLDSFGLEGKDNECGGIYTIRAPTVNMCLPPLSWQTYDIDFVAAEFDDEGKMTRTPRITVRHNGVLIHKDVELPKSTTAAPLQPGPEPGPVYLQDHGNPVRYRNVWVVPKS